MKSTENGEGSTSSTEQESPSLGPEIVRTNIVFAVVAVGREHDIKEFAVAMAESISLVAGEAAGMFNVEIVEEAPDLQEPTG